MNLWTLTILEIMNEAIRIQEQVYRILVDNPYIENEHIIKIYPEKNRRWMLQVIQIVRAKISMEKFAITNETQIQPRHKCPTVQVERLKVEPKNVFVNEKGQTVFVYESRV